MGWWALTIESSWSLICLGVMSSYHWIHLVSHSSTFHSNPLLWRTWECRWPLLKQLLCQISSSLSSLSSFLIRLFTVSHYLQNNSFSHFLKKSPLWEWDTAVYKWIKKKNFLWNLKWIIMPASSSPEPQGAIILSHNSLHRVKHSHEQVNHLFQVPINAPAAVGKKFAGNKFWETPRYSFRNFLFFPLINAQLLLEYVI